MADELKGFIEKDRPYDLKECYMCKKNYSGMFYKKFSHPAIRALMGSSPIIICRKCAIREAGYETKNCFEGKIKKRIQVLD